MNDSQLNTNWEKLFNKYQILNSINQNGHFEISALKIKEFREPRLMTKFDHSSQLPKLFAENNLSILPLTRGSYVIGSFETFQKFNNDDCTIEYVPFPSYVESLNYNEITSEATAINCSFITQILHNFIEEENLLPTVSGRMSSGGFDFNINTLQGSVSLNVLNSQIEIDGGYEGTESLCLIEAKNQISTDFLIRQLYYPYRLWNGKITKKVRPIFLTYTNGTFHLREYIFVDPNNYNSIHLIRQKKYIIREEEFNTENLQQLLVKTPIVSEPPIPFPQADSFDRIINICELLKTKGIMTKSQFFYDYDLGTIDARQHDYYTNAALYLGLVSKINAPLTNETAYTLSDLGKRIMAMDLFNRKINFIELIISHNIFRRVLLSTLEEGVPVSKHEVIQVMKEEKPYKVEKESTYFRRSSTVSSWVKWIINQIEEQEF